MVNLQQNHNIFNDFSLKHKLFIDDLANYPHSKNDCYPKLWNNNLIKTYMIYMKYIPNFLLNIIPNFFLSTKNKRNKSQLWVKKILKVNMDLKI